MKRNTPTRVVETGRLARGPSGQGVGWLQSLAERARNIQAQLVGVQERLNTPFVNGVPACVADELTFVADTTQTITITNFPPDPDAVPPAAFVALTVNPIFTAGKTYRIPITYSPPGVLRADKLVVGIEAGYTMFANNNRPGITPLNDYRQKMVRQDVVLDSLGGGFVPFPDVGTIQYTWQQQVLCDFTTVVPFIPFLWNIIDEKSGRQYGQDWIPSGALLNTRGNSMQSVVIPDSELYEFGAPWLFERDAQVAFLFRPIMDLYQIASGSATFPYGFRNGVNPNGVSDLTGGRRQEQATVRVEFHGNRYYSAQDALKDGAFVTNSEPRRHPYGLDDTDNG